MIPYKFEDFFPGSVKDAIGIAIGISLNLCIILGNKDILRILTLSVY